MTNTVTGKGEKEKQLKRMEGRDIFFLGNSAAPRPVNLLLTYPLINVEMFFLSNGCWNHGNMICVSLTFLQFCHTL